MGEDGYVDSRYDAPFYPRFWPSRLDDIKFSGAWWDTLRGRKAKGVFVCDMGELFGDWLPVKWQKEVFDVIKSDPLDRFYLLTKQPQNLIKFSPFPENCYIGVTATNTKEYLAALAGLAVIKAKVKYISFEPLLNRIIVNPPYTFSGDIDWIIIGAQTKPYKAPKIEWVKEIVEAADKAGTPVFLKDNLWSLLLSNPIEILTRPIKIAYEMDGILATADISGSNWGREGDFAVDMGGTKRLKIKEVLDIKLRQEMPK